MMHNVYVKMKDGTERCNPLWCWRPAEGWFTLFGAPEDKIYLRDVVSAVQYGQRVSVKEPCTDVDLLTRARKEGWSEDEDDV